ncbi:hypothetical protein D3C80_1484630 [compost metagenome]
MGQIQPDHGQRPLFIEHDVRGFRIDLDIKFRHRAPVAHVVATAHQHHFFHSFGNAWFFAHRHGDVGQAAGRNQRHAAWRVSHDGIDDQINRVAGFQRQRWLR